MRQNMKCIKNILFFTQDNISPSHPYLSLNDFLNELNQYSKDEIVFHLRLLHEQGLFSVFVMDDLNLIGKYGDLSPEGHAVAEAARNDTLWNKAVSTGKGLLPDVIKCLLFGG